MASKRKTQYRFEDPATQQYLIERSDGTFGLTPNPNNAIGRDTSVEAITYSSTRLHSTPHEIVRVS